MSNKHSPPLKSSNSPAYTVNIGAKGSSKDENWSVNQTSPTWVLSFVRWSVRDTLRTKPTQEINFSTTRASDPLVVENDCIQCSIATSKSNLTDSMSAVLVMTDTNYETDLAPGDFVFVNMLNWESEARRVARNAKSHKPINGINDGFKGVYKIQGVRKNLIIDPVNGTKMYTFHITGFSFTEFNNTIYFNQELIDVSEKNNLLLFASNIRANWQAIYDGSLKGITNVQDLIQLLIGSFVGYGIGDTGRHDKNGIIKSVNTLFHIPKLVGALLGVPSAKAAKDIYNYLMGIQTYSGGNKTQSLSAGMNPIGFTASDGRFFIPNDAFKCQGDTISKPEYWDQKKVWSILNQFVNAPLNELFTCLRVSPDGKVMPTVVFRQIPFTTEDFNDDKKMPVTRFMTLPRWKISPSLVLSMDIGRDESARINFVQYFSVSSLGPAGWSVSMQTAQSNFLYDVDDVKRNGLRPYVISTTFDEAIQGKTNYRSTSWARIIGDSLIGGNLKMNGTIECVGIVDPIAVGDNLEFDGVVYHIEQISHNCSVSGPDGMKTFRTSIMLSSGMSKSSSKEGTKYSEMSHADAYSLREIDYKNNQIIPGVSEAQDVIYRPNNPDNAKHSPDSSFKQPNKNTSIDKSGRENEFDAEKDKK